MFTKHVLMYIIKYAFSVYLENQIITHLQSTLYLIHTNNKILQNMY